MTYGADMQNPEAHQPPGRSAFLNLGFRPFFAGAAVFSVLSILLWTGAYTFNLPWVAGGLPPVIWHAHEMIYGYSLAVIAGFLLTAVKNWTGVQTPYGTPLLLLFLAWVAGRVFFAAGDAVPLELAAVADTFFMLLLIAGIALPVIKVRQWKQIGILSKLVLILVSNLLFYAGALGLLQDGMRIGLYSGLYLIVALIFVMGRRVIPFFIENGVGYPVQLKNRSWLDAAGLAVFLMFWLADSLQPDTLLVAVLSAALFVLHGARLAGWYTAGIWQKPLLWVLYLGYGWLVLGFALKTAVYVFGVSPFPALHAFAFGGVGMLTLGMMARVTLGHTGRSVFEPPAILPWLFSPLLLGAIIRVFLPLLDPSRHALWIGLSQALWIISFVLFITLFLPMLVRPRVDGKFG